MPACVSHFITHTTRIFPLCSSGPHKVNSRLLGEFALGDDDLPDATPAGVGSNFGVRASRSGKYRSAGDRGGVADGRSTSLGEGRTRLLHLDDADDVASTLPLVEGLEYGRAMGENEAVPATSPPLSFLSSSVSYSCT